MKIKSVHDTSFIEMTFCCDNVDAPQNKDDLAINVEVFSSEGFCGKCNEVWFQRSVFEQFIQDLEVLESTRRGSVTLSTCPQSEYADLEFKISSIDTGQTMFVEIDLLKTAYTPDDRFRPFKVSAHFVFDPSVLHRIIADFKHLFRVGNM